LFSIISKNSLHFNFLYAISKILSAMNGKITDFRRKERIGRRLQANLRQLRLVRPGAAMETWPDRPPLSWTASAYDVHTNLGGTAEV
jgi:hypothetical protein